MADDETEAGFEALCTRYPRIQYYRKYSRPARRWCCWEVGKGGMMMKWRTMDVDGLFGHLKGIEGNGRKISTHTCSHTKPSRTHHLRLDPLVVYPSLVSAVGSLSIPSLQIACALYKEAVHLITAEGRNLAKMPHLESRDNINGLEPEHNRYCAHYWHLILSSILCCSHIESKKRLLRQHAHEIENRGNVIGKTANSNRSMQHKNRPVNNDLDKGSTPINGISMICGPVLCCPQPAHAFKKKKKLYYQGFFPTNVIKRSR